MEKALLSFGWFDDLSQQPTFDPGLGVACPVCGNELSAEPRTTISVAAAENRTRSYFFRAHKRCWSASSEAERIAIESGLIDGDGPTH